MNNFDKLGMINALRQLHYDLGDCVSTSPHWADQHKCTARAARQDIENLVGKLSVMFGAYNYYINRDDPLRNVFDEAGNAEKS